MTTSAPVGYEELVAYYRRRDKDPIKFARMLVEYKQRTGHSWQFISVQTDLGAGTLTHYKSLVDHLPEDLQQMVSDGRLQFRLARPLATASLTDERKRELLKPILDGKLKGRLDGSSLAEKYLLMAKKYPSLKPWQLTDAVLNNRTPAQEPVDVDPPVKLRAPSWPRVTSADMKQAALDMIGMLGMWERDQSTDTLMADSFLKRLCTQMQEVVR